MPLSWGYLWTHPNVQLLDGYPEVRIIRVFDGDAGGKDLKAPATGDAKQLEVSFHVCFENRHKGSFVLFRLLTPAPKASESVRGGTWRWFFIPALEKLSWTPFWSQTVDGEFCENHATGVCMALLCQVHGSVHLADGRNKPSTRARLRPLLFLHLGLNFIASDSLFLG